MWKSKYFMTRVPKLKLRKLRKLRWVIYLQKLYRPKVIKNPLGLEIKFLDRFWSASITASSFTGWVRVQKKMTETGNLNHFCVSMWIGCFFKLLKRRYYSFQINRFKWTSFYSRIFTQTFYNASRHTFTINEK